MNLKKLKQKVHKGFTLLEMIVVIGIIGVLLLVAVPAVANYYTNSRLNSANSDAKVLFNSMQTIMQEYEFSERGAQDSFFYGTAKGGKLFMKGNAGEINAVSINGTAKALSDFNVGGRDRLGTTDSPDPATVGGRLVRLFPDYKETAWCVYIEDYKVKGVLCATANDSVYVGGYPVKADEKSDPDLLKGKKDIGGAGYGEVSVVSW